MARDMRELTCINCPLGCQLTVTLVDGTVTLVSGNSCPRGDVYGRAEVSNPQRVVTTTVRSSGSTIASMLPVKTAGSVPKERVRAVVQALANVKVQAPVSLGEVVLADVCGTGIDVVATKNI